MMGRDFWNFIKHVRSGYLLFTSLLILGFFYGSFEIIKIVFFDNTSDETMQVLYFSRGITVSLSLMVWAAWTVYNYRELYQEQLDTAEQKYRDIIEHSADAIITLNHENEITSWNQGAEQILGWEADEIVGAPLEKIIPQSLLEKGELKQIQEAMYPNGYTTNYETERLHKNGESILVSLTESLIRNENDQVIGRSKILRDLTDLKIKEEQIQHSERLATLGHMAAGVAHEVGNPLTAISSLVQLCQRRTDDPFIQDQLTKVREHIHRITKIVRDLVDFSRPSSLETEVMNINTLVESAVGLLKHDARCRNVEFIMNLSQDLPKLEGVPDHIHQVFVNILLNAVDAMEKVKKPAITIASREENKSIKISITDIGMGIPEEEQNRIFEPFFTTKEVGSGTGLGLSVSHGIINQMDGNIEVDSEPGKGTTFTITLPVQQK
ncbi:two-component system sensor histidine kinase NtrB [Fodinibius salsisoli]|uniref:histidine kinase n=1 Tax=Fodinibius salsisoli TaxID=2820877 RepID=A0ABT3PMX4_9BACT|nr:ATP-binding protein [Fodinibius salsisoli]MCW9707291.1 PAS domain S-box protein [Fodinibius salsisoli]